tara:strand:+ start:161067 stop:161939 length:873 start_codon:yes stop_codon:yes gene_type:complete
LPFSPPLKRAKIAAEKLRYFNNPDLEFPRSAWSPALRAQVIVSQFAARDWTQELTTTDYRKRSNEFRSETTANKPGLLGELLTLLSMRNNKRQEFANEIAAQVNGTELYWSNAFMIGIENKPNSTILMAVAMAVGQLVGMHFKDHWNRARPVQFAPSLMPIIPTPAHPSYPSGHALQAYLTMHLLSAAAKASEGDALHDYFASFAERIAVNREIAGVHFPTDKLESADLAEQIWEGHLSKLPAIQELLAHAWSEWEHNLNPEEFELDSLAEGPVSFADQMASEIAAKLPS